MFAGQLGYKFPQVAIVADDKYVKRWSGKTKFTASEHWYADRVVVHPRWQTPDDKYEK